ncbi:MAG: hypothetical protein GX652_10405 [Burkholderiaceae bacterium]|nr:hypothetical protein [Burkholderiaceae bacterium]
MRLTHPERVVYAERGTTKGDVADYYVSVMPWLLPEIINRPVSVVRCSKGTDSACFFQRHHTAGLKLVDVVQLREDSGELGDYLVVRNAESVMELVQFKTIEFHPWGALAESPDVADRVVFDLDPGDGVGWPELARAATEIREWLSRRSLRSFLRTSGGRGLHVVVPLLPGCDWARVKPFAREVAVALAAQAPDRYVASAPKHLRAGRIFIDYLRNGRSATSIASYSLRARPGAPVAAPLSWDELDPRHAVAFDIDTMPERLRRIASDPWEGIDEVRQALPAGSGVA